jgi:hypothetical protein
MVERAGQVPVLHLKGLFNSIGCELAYDMLRVRGKTESIRSI